jgi:hypothetical protein
MKKFLLTTAMVMCAFLFNNESKAQVRFGLNVNFGSRPSWGLADNYAGDYYYMPDIDTYYDIPHRQFIYYEGNNWVFASQLPYQYRNYDLNRGYKVAINEYKPYLHADVYRNRYGNYGRNDQFVGRGGFDNHFDRDRHERMDDHFDGRRDENRFGHNEIARNNDRDRNFRGRH